MSIMFCKYCEHNPESSDCELTKVGKTDKKAFARSCAATLTMNVKPKTNLTRIASMMLGILAVAVVTGCGSSRTILQQDAAQYPEAVRLYQNGCITCHGSNLQGGIGLNLQHVGSRLTAAQIRHRIEVGSGPMPAYAAPGDAILTSAQITALTNWLASKK